MANLVTKRGIVIVDTAADAIIAAGTPVRISLIRWVGGVATNVLTLADSGTSVILCEAIFQAVNIDNVINFGIKPLGLDGLRVLTITSGRAYIHLL